MRNKIKINSWRYDTTKTSARKKVKRLRNKALRRNLKEIIAEEWKGRRNEGQLQISI